MSKNEQIFSKENWQSIMMSPGPSNHNDLGLPTTQKFRQTSTGRPMKQTWTCGVCRKELSSKRSYTEHMNIHNKSRPFQCEHCTYAAASQMTLHRHRLRNHTPKTEWGYRCPYCDDAYMEPAGYQQHVQQRHSGKSCTYGCPFKICKFTSKSQRHFREHLVKHDRSDKLEGTVDPCALTNQQLTRYMVSDEIGHGFQRPASATTPTITIRARQQVTIAPKGSEEEPRIVWHVENVIPNKTQIRNNVIPPKPPPAQRYYVPSNAYQPSQEQEDHYNQQHHYHQMQYEEAYEEDISDEEEEYEDDGPPILESFVTSHPHVMEQQQHVMVHSEWEMNEEVEIPAKEGVFPNGFIDDELD